jgi:hypothetical protein
MAPPLTNTPEEREFQGRLRRVEALVGALEGCRDPAAREGARELVRALLDLHAAGLARMLHLASDRAEPGQVVERFAQDDLVSGLLLLHGLHPVPLADRVARALDRVRTDLRRRGGEADLLGVTTEAVRVRLRGDPSAGPVLRRAVEDALTEAAPDVPRVVFEEAWDRPPSGRVALPLLG